VQLRGKAIAGEASVDDKAVFAGTASGDLEYVV
jgi:hypothetical protein